MVIRLGPRADALKTCKKSVLFPRLKSVVRSVPSVVCSCNRCQWSCPYFSSLSAFLVMQGLDWLSEECDGHYVLFDSVPLR